MSYEVFARKYRPQTFDDLVGQNHVSRTLRNAVEQNRLAHAYLFVGPRGTGKTSTARILAKALNCAASPRPTISPCGQCDNCREIAAGNSLDVLEIDGASNNGVEQVRELRDNVRYAPVKSRFKIYIIDEVHMLTAAAFNALLKTLEEPPAHVKFIFATTEPQKVLPTIISRCQRFDLHRIAPNLIAGQLSRIAAQENVVLTPAAAHAIARGAEGGMRDAESMLDQLVSFCGDEIDEPQVLSVFGFTSEQVVSDFAGRILHGETAAALELLHGEGEAGKEMMKLISDLIAYLRDLLVFKIKPEAVSDETTAPIRAALAHHGESVETNRLLELIDQFSAAESRMKWAPNKKLHFEVAVIKAIQTLNQVTLDEVIENLSAMREGSSASNKGASIDSLRTKPTPRPVEEKQKPDAKSGASPHLGEKGQNNGGPGKSPSESAPAEAAPLAEPETVWVKVRERIPKHRGFLQGLAAAAQLERTDGGRWVLSFPPEQRTTVETVGTEPNRKLLESLLHEVTGQDWSVKFVVREAEPGGGEREPTAPAKGHSATSAPLVREALAMFEGEIKEAR